MHPQRAPAVTESPRATTCQGPAATGSKEGGAVLEGGEDDGPEGGTEGGTDDRVGDGGGAAAAAPLVRGAVPHPPTRTRHAAAAARTVAGLGTRSP